MVFLMLLVGWFGIIKICWLFNLNSCCSVILIDNMEKKNYNFVPTFLAGIQKIVEYNSE